MAKLSKNHSVPSPQATFGLLDFSFFQNPYFGVLASEAISSDSRSLGANCEMDEAMASEILADTLGILRESIVVASSFSDFAAWMALSRSRVAYLANPDPVTGLCFGKAALTRFIEEQSDLDFIVIDESYLDFSGGDPDSSLQAMVLSADNLMVVKNLGKSLANSELSLGYAVTNPEMASLMKRSLPQRGLSNLAEEAVYSLNRELDAYRLSFQKIAEDRRYLNAGLRRLPGLSVSPLGACFSKIQFREPKRAIDCARFLFCEHSIVVCDARKDASLRSNELGVAFRPAPEVDRLLSGLTGYLNVPFEARY